MSTLRISARLGAMATMAVIATSAPGAGAAGLDDAIYDAGVPAGQVEHGAYQTRLTGSPIAYVHRTEYWITAGRWRDQTTDAKTGELLSGRIHDEHGTTWLQYKPVNSDPRVLHFNGNDSVPGPGYPAAYNRKLVAGEIVHGTEQAPLAITLQPIRQVTIAGFAGTEYEQLSNGQPGLVQAAHGPLAGSHITMTLQNGTSQPLMREARAPNGSLGNIVQRDQLISRETTSISRASAGLSSAAIKRTILSWKAKVKAAKANKKKHKKK